jgi:hypothetical protein
VTEPAAHQHAVNRIEELLTTITELQKTFACLRIASRRPLGAPKRPRCRALLLLAPD